MLQNSIGEQLEFVDKFGDSIREEALYSTLHAVSELCHQGVGWIWDGCSLQAKEAELGEDYEQWGASHYALFGEAANKAWVRGWYCPVKQHCTIQSGYRQITSSDEIPESLYRKLINRFKTIKRWVVC